MRIESDTQRERYNAAFTLKEFYSTPHRRRNMERRHFIALSSIIIPFCSGCTAFNSGATTESPPGTSISNTKPGQVDNHRITAVTAVSHEVIRRHTENRDEWVVRITLEIKPQDTDRATVYPIGVHFIFLNDDGDEIYQEFKTVEANTGGTPRTVTLSGIFRPTEATADSFDRYRIDLVHP